MRCERNYRAKLDTVINTLSANHADLKTLYTYYWWDVLVQITMPSGTMVTATHTCARQEGCYLDVNVYPLAEDAGNSEGLCGNFNAQQDDDLPAGTDLDEFNLQPIEFVKKYMSVA